VTNYRISTTNPNPNHNSNPNPTNPNSKTQIFSTSAKNFVIANPQLEENIQQTMQNFKDVSDFVCH